MSSSPAQAPLSYLFLIRSFNDVDHILPLIHRMATSGRARPYVLCTDPAFDLRGMNHAPLLESLGVETRHYHQETRGLRRLCCALLQRAHERTTRKSGAASRLALTIRRIIQLLVRADRRCFERLYQERNIQAILADWCKTSKFPLSRFVREGHRLGLPSVALPHGLIMFYEGDTMVSQEEYAFDAFLTCGPASTTYYGKRGVPEAITHDLGNMRFSQQWLDERQRLGIGVEPKDLDRLPNPEGKLRLVFFMRKKTANEFVMDELRETLRVLGKIPNAVIALKANTRDQTVVTLAGEKLPDNIFLPDPSINSSVLVHWADACLNYGSSIAYEIYTQGKPHIHLNYLVQTQYEYLNDGSALVLETPDAIAAACERLRSQQEPLTKAQAVDELITRNVYAGTRGDVVQRYWDLLEQVCRETHKAKEVSEEQSECLSAA